MDLKAINLLQDRKIEKGERWILSEGFDVEPGLKSTERIDVALKDIEQLADSGAVVSILSHQRRFLTKPLHLDFVADYLMKKLGRKVVYFPDNNTLQALDFARQMQAGDITIFGNTRFNDGEEKNDVELAKHFAKFGDFAAIGGWCKAHRKQASNFGILEYIPGFMARSQLREMRLLEPWAGKSDKYSVAVLGGVKKEKITEGLAGFVKTYDAIIPGGIVLNTIYLVKGRQIGKSLVADEGKVCDKEVKAILDSEDAGKICVPEEVIIAEAGDIHKRYSIRTKIAYGVVPKDHMIVDYVMPESAKSVLEKLARVGGRMVIAGTPGLYKEGFREATYEVLRGANLQGVRAIALGGDTASELKDEFSGTRSIGGGASLVAIARGTTPSYEALKANRKRFV